MQNKEILLIIQGEPIAKTRARKTRRSGKWYNPQTEIMNIIKKQITDQLPDGFPIKKGIPVKCIVYAFFRPPKAKKQILYENDDVPCLNKKDFDNIAKLYTDTMNKIVYYDDNQIYSGTCEKYYSLKPRVEIKLSWQENQ